MGSQVEVERRVVWWVVDVGLVDVTVLVEAERGGGRVRVQQFRVTTAHSGSRTPTV
jgi:hypothetical protein